MTYHDSWFFHVSSNKSLFGQLKTGIKVGLNYLVHSCISGLKMKKYFLILIIGATVGCLCDGYKVSNICKLVYCNGTESSIQECEKGEICLPPTDVKLFFCGRNVSHLCRIEVYGEIVRSLDCPGESDCVERFQRDSRVEKWRCQCENVEDEECRLKMRLRSRHNQRMKKHHSYICKKIFPNDTSITRPCPSTYTCRPPPEVKFFCKDGSYIGRVCRIEEFGEIIEEADCEEGQECLPRNETSWRCIKNNKVESFANEKWVRSRKKWGNLWGIHKRLVHKGVCKIQYAEGYEKIIKECPAPLICKSPPDIKFSVCSNMDDDNYHPMVCKIEKDGRTIRQRVCPQNGECIESEMKRRKSMWKCKCPEDMDDCEDKEWNNRKEKRKMKKMLRIKKEGDQYRIGFKKRT